jgi:hypothetical protein
MCRWGNDFRGFRERPKAVCSGGDNREGGFFVWKDGVAAIREAAGGEAGARYITGIGNLLPYLYRQYMGYTGNILPI